MPGRAVEALGTVGATSTPTPTDDCAIAWRCPSGQGVLALDSAREVYQPAVLTVSDQIVPISVSGDNDFDAFKAAICSLLG